MDQENKIKWEEMTQMMAEDEVSLGECLVTTKMIGDRIVIVITNMYGMGFNMAMPDDVVDGIKETMISMAETAFIDPEEFDEDTVKDSLVTGYVNTVLPELSEEMREQVSDIEPLRAVLAVMSYLNLLKWAMEGGDTDIITLGPDGNLYTDSDEMPFSPGEIFEQVQRLSGLDEIETDLMIDWIPEACKSFDGMFPGYMCKDDGIGVSVKLVSPEMATAFARTAEKYWGDGLEDDDDDDSVEDIIDTMEDIVDMVKKVVPNAIVSKIPVENALDMMDLSVLLPNEKDAMRLTLLKVYAGKGERVPTYDAIPATMDPDSSLRIVDLIDSTRKEKPDFPFMWHDGDIIYTG